MKFELLDNRTGQKADIKTMFEAKRIKNSLVFLFDAYESSLNSYSDKDNGELFKGDVVEVFLDLGLEEYFEFEVAPNGKNFVATIKERKPPLIPNDFFKSEVVIKDQNYFVKMMIDLSKFNNVKDIKFNAFRIETKGIKTEYYLQALSPTLCNDFHIRDKFVILK